MRLQVTGPITDVDQQGVRGVQLAQLFGFDDPDIVRIRDGRIPTGSRRRLS